MGIVAIAAWLYFWYLDYSEILPYIENLNNPVLYSNDFYVTHIISIVPNVRWFFAECALFFVGNLSSWFFVFHAFSTIFLLMGTMKVCHKLSVSIPFSFLGIMGYLLLFYGKIPVEMNGISIIFRQNLWLLF